MDLAARLTIVCLDLAVAADPLLPLCSPEPGACSCPAMIASAKTHLFFVQAIVAWLVCLQPAWEYNSMTPGDYNVTLH